MSNELQEFLALIGRLIKWIFLWTLNLLAICIFLVSLLALWRTIWIIKNVLFDNNDDFDWYDFRIKSVIHFGLIFIDVFAFLLGFLSLIFITRIPHFFMIFHQTLKESFSSNSYEGCEYEYTSELRTKLSLSFLMGILDIFCLIFGLCSLVIPTRTAAFFRCCYEFSDEYFDDRYAVLRLCWLKNFFLAICDCIAIPHFVLALPMFTRSYHLFKESIEIWNDYGADLAFDDCLSYKIQYRIMALQNFYTGLVDLICLSFGILSLFMPTRWLAFFRTFSLRWDRYLNDNYWTSIRWSLVMNFVCAILDLIVFLHLIFLPVMFTRYYHIILRDYEKKEYCEFGTDAIGENLKYQRNIRFWIFRNFYCGVLDILVLFVGILSFIFIVRIVCFFKLFASFYSDYKADEYDNWRRAVVINFMLGFLDLIFLCCVILVICSLIRSVPLISDLKKHQNDGEYIILNDYKLNYNYKQRLDVIKHFAFLWIDILFVPLLICCLLSIYHGIELCHLIYDTTKWNESRMMLIRKKILINFLLLIFDMIFILPLLLLIMCTAYRICFIFKQFGLSWNVYYHNRQIRLRNLYGNVSGDVEMVEINVPETVRMTVPETVRIHLFLNVLLIIFVDLLFMLMAVIVIILTAYRLSKCMDIIKESLERIKDLEALETYEIILLCRWDIFVHFLGILLDIPCVILATCVFLTLWRSTILYEKLKNGTDSYKQFRYTVFRQFIYLLRDIIFFIPFFLIVFTFWRLPLLILGLLAKCRTPRISNDETIHLTVKQCQLQLPEKGKAMLHIVADKEDGFILTDNLNACRLFVLGNAFWENVESSFGGAIATAGQSQLPNKLTHGEENGFDYNLCGADISNDIPITFTLQTPKIRRTKIAKELDKFEQNDTEFILQLEHDDKGVLFVIILSISDLINAANDEDGCVDLSTDINMDRVNNIRGTEYLGVIDTFYIIVGMQFGKWCVDILHLLLFISLIVMAPWRFVQCVQLVFEHQNKWYLRQNAKAIGRIAHGNNIYHKLMDLLFDPMLNDLVKEKYINNANDAIAQYIDTDTYYDALCHELEEFWYDNINEFGMNQQVENNQYSMNVNMRLSNYDSVIKETLKILNKIKPIPATKNLVMHLFETQNILIYLKVMQCNCNILRMENKLKWETHSILIEQINVKQENYKNQIKYFQNAIQKSHNELMIATHFKKPNKNKKCAGLCSKSLDFTYKLIRYSFKRAILDLCAIIILILIFCTVYRIIPLVRDTVYLFKFKTKYKENRNIVIGPSLRYGFRQIIEKHIKGFVIDLSLLCQLLFWSLIILISLLRIFDYISHLFTGAIKRGKPSLTLAMAVEIARYETGMIWEDISSVFYLMFMPTTYKYAISALIFGTFLPSAAFLEMFALLCSCLPRRVRQILSILIWFGLFITILYIAGSDYSTQTIETYKFAIFAFITLAVIAGFFIALFLCVKCRNFKDYKEEIFHRESRIVTRVCSTCDNLLSLLSVNSNNKICFFCDANVNGQVFGCNLCDQYWCDQCINILRTEADLLQQEEEKKEENDDENPWDDHADLAKINKPEIANNVATILWSYPTDDFIPFHIRFCWINAIAIFGILLDFFQLTSILFYMFYINQIFELDASFKINIDNGFISISKWTLLANFSYNGYMTVSVITLVFGFFWVIICSLPLVCEQLFSQWGVPNGHFTKSTLWIKTCWLYSRVFFVTFVINLLKLSQCIYTAAGDDNNDNNDTDIWISGNDDNDVCLIISGYHSESEYDIMSILSFGLLIFFWFTTSIVLVYKNAQICWEQSDNLDIRYPLAFINGLQLFQSIYVVFGVLIILDNMRIGLFGCLIVSYLMVLWHLSYPFISKFIISEKNKENHQYRIYAFSSITYLNSLQTTFYIIIAYIATILYLFVSSSSLNMNINMLLSYGSLIILSIGILLSFIIKKISYKRRLKKLHETELKYIIKSLTNLYEATSHNKCVGDWYTKIGQTKFELFTQNVWSTPKDLAYLLIAFERHILYERINQNFLLNRFRWKKKLLSFDKFHQFIASINELKEAIQSPPFFTLALNCLCNESELFKYAPIEICFLIMQFIVDCKEIIQVADDTLLNPQNLIIQVADENIISRIKIFGATSTKELSKYVDSLKDLENNGDIE